jgi:hypothetical protein
LEYLESIGLAQNGELHGIASCPLVLLVPDGSRLVRTVYDVENEELLCSGVVTSFTPMEISFCDREFVLKSARKIATECKQWLDSTKDSGSRIALVVSCAARRWTLGSDVYAEVREIDKGLENLPYHFTYSRGEFCPSNIHEGKTVNYFFNYSLCICIL